MFYSKQFLALLIIIIIIKWPQMLKTRALLMIDNNSTKENIICWVWWLKKYSFCIVSNWRLQFIKWLIHVYSCLLFIIMHKQWTDRDIYLINHFIELFETNDKHDYHKMSIYLRIASQRQTHSHTSSCDYIICDFPTFLDDICWHGFILSAIYYLSLFIFIIL